MYALFDQDLLPFPRSRLGDLRLCVVRAKVSEHVHATSLGCMGYYSFHRRRALILKRCMAETSEAEGRHEGRYHMTWVIPSRRARGALTATSIERRNAPVSTRLLRSEIWSPSAAAPLCSQGRGGARDVRWTGRSVFQLRPHDPSSLGCSIRSLIVSVLFCLWYISEEAGSRGRSRNRGSKADKNRGRIARSIAPVCSWGARFGTACPANPNLRDASVQEAGAVSSHDFPNALEHQAQSRPQARVLEEAGLPVLRCDDLVTGRLSKGAGALVSAKAKPNSVSVCEELRKVEAHALRRL